MELFELEQRLDYAFADRGLLILALTHSSYAYQQEEESNERLEFLGDAVIELCISSILFDRYTEAGEGKLSILRSLLVSKKALIKVAVRLKLDQFIRLGPEMDGKASGRRYLSSCIEALIGAVYLDGGLERSRGVIDRLWEPLLKNLKYRQNYKNLLQQQLQKEGRKLPVYEVTGQLGDLTTPIFEVRLLIDGREVSRGRARSKKMAEQIAALRYLKRG